VSPVTNSPNETRYRQGRRAAENVERALLADIAPLLPGFVAACDMAQMLYMTPLLVTTLSHYPEELSIQLQLVEAMHRIIHLPLSCWTDLLTCEEGEEEDDACINHHNPQALCVVKPHDADDTGSNACDQTSKHDGRLTQDKIDGIFTPVKSTPSAAGSNTGHGDAESPRRQRKHRPSGLLYVSRDPPRKYASCCTPLRGQRRYAYLRPQLMEPQVLEGHESALGLSQPPPASPSSHHPAAPETRGSLSKAHTRAFEQVCEAFVNELLRIVELQNTEIALFRAALVSFHAHSLVLSSCER
jgi:hypothetical protein